MHGRNVNDQNAVSRVDNPDTVSQKTLKTIVNYYSQSSTNANIPVVDHFQT